MEAHIEVTAAGECLRLSLDVQRALVRHMLTVIRQYADGVLRPLDDWRILVAVGMLAEWATHPIYGMLDWPGDEALWSDEIEPLLQELEGTPFEPQARLTRQTLKWAASQQKLPFEQRHVRLTASGALNSPAVDVP